MRFPPGSFLKWLVPAVACVALATPAAASAALDQGPGGPILVVTGGTDHFGSYYAEILRAEGLNEFDVSPLASVTAATLAAHAVVILGETPVSASEALMLDTWVQAGGDLIAMRPDASLSSLLGLTNAGGTLADSYLKVDTSTAPGAGIVGDTIQYHGAADRYTLNGASAIATLYSDASTATANPAVTLRSVGANGGHAAAFAYDLARSVVYTRQGNPAWVGQERDGIAPIRSDDLFFGAASGDPQPDWVNLGKVAIPQADEQQRLLANLIGEIDPAPLPRFWYFPHSAKAVVVMTGDDHAGGGTAGRFDAYAAASAPGCSVADWQCVRSTSYLVNGSPLTDAQAAAYQAAGFEVALHADTGCTTQTQAQFDATLSAQLATFASQYPSAATPVTNRTHCIAWGGWVDPAVVEQQHGIRLDTNYYYWPPNWVQDRPGMFTGSGMPMRFAGLDGSMLDVYQAATQMTDESGQSYPFTADALLSKAVGPQGYYGAFTANMHTDSAASSGSDGILAAAQSRGVPIVSARQMLTWLDGRNASSFGSIAFTGHTLGFTIAAGSGARGLTAMVPTHSSAGVLSGLQRDGSPATFTTETIKGVDYAFFAADAGTYQASYAPAPSGLTDTTSADFGAGDPGTGTQVVGSGDVILRAGLDEAFDGLTLPAGWTSGSWTGGGAAVSGGSLVVDGGWAATSSFYSAGRTIEFDATFGGQPFGHAGFGVDLNNDPDWAMFSTGSDGAQLYARTNGPSATNTPLGAGYLNGSHHFRIDWKPLSVDFFIDGTLVATHNVSISAAMRPIVSDFNSGGAVVSVDRLTLSPPYVASGTFTSRVMDAGATVDFTTLTWTADTPSGTAVAMSARTGDTPVPDGTWTAFAPIASSGDTVGGHARYVQYRAALSTSDSGVTPVLHDVTAGYGDTTAPQTQIDSGPSGTIAVSSASFAFSSDDGAATFECRLDGGAWGACSSPKAFASLTDGSHTFEVRATDAAGNTDPTPALRAFTVSTDTTAPQTQIDSGPSGTIAVSSASFAFSSDDGAATFECRLDGGAWGVCSSPKAYASLTDGSHTFEVRATDAAHNTDGSPAARTFTVDTHGPVTTILTEPANPTNLTSATFTFSATDASGPATLACSLDGAAFAACSSPQSYASLADGSHTFRVHGTDTVGNAGADASYAWTVSTTGGPLVTIDWPKDGGRYSVDKPVGVAWSCSSPLGIAHQESTPVADGQPLPSTLGSATFTATCEDTAGHVTTKSIHYTMETFGQIITDDNPSAYFRLGEAAGDDWVRDSSGNHHDGEAKNATAWEEFGISGDGDSARRFIGDGGYVYVNGIEAPKTALTLGGWVKFDDTGDADVLDHGYDAGIYLHDGHLSFRMLGTTVTDPATVQADRWYFVAGTWNGGTMKLWTASGLPSGTNLATVAASATQGKRPSGYSTFYIGYGQDEPWLRGAMDEVFYYPSALAAGHLQELWLADPPARAKTAGAPAAAAAGTGTASAAPGPLSAQSRTTSSNTAAKARARAKAQHRARAKQLAKARARARARAHRRAR